MADIINRTEDWEDHSGAEIQKFIKSELNSCVGYFQSYDVDNTSNILVGFVDKDTCDAWELEFGVSTQPSEEALKDSKVLSYTKVAKSIPEDFYSAQLINLYKSNKYISIDRNVIIPVKYVYSLNRYDVNNSSFETIVEPDEGTLTIQAKPSTVSSWTDSTVKEMTMQVNSNEEVSLNLTSFVETAGKWDLRMRATNGDKNIQSSWVTYTVIKTFIDVNLTTDWKTYQEGKLSLRFNFEGDYVDKYLNIEVTGAGETAPGTKKEILDRPLSSGSGSYSQTIESLVSDSYHTFAHGIHNIKYWITIDKDPNYATEPKYAQIMVVGDKTNTTPYVIFHNLKGDTEENPLINWIQNDVVEFAVYAPNGKGGTLTDFETIFEFKDNAGKTILTSPFEMNYGESKVLNASLTLESNVLALWLYCTSGTGANMLGSSNYIQLYVSNMGDYAPSTEGIRFVLNPRTRSNNESETERVKIYNTASSSAEEVKNVMWKNMSFNDYDGWIQDSNGIKCLRILDGSSLTIPYQVFEQDDPIYTSYTVEMTMAIRNVVDPNIPILSIKNENEGVINGFEMCGSRGYFLIGTSKDNKDIMDASDIMYTEDTKMHITLCVNNFEKRSGDVIKATIPIKTNPKEYKDVTLGSNHNFVRMYIDGVLNRIISFSDGEINPDLVRDLVIGNTTGSIGADIDIYEIRVFKSDSAKPDYEILKDYCASLTTTEEKDKVINRNKVLGGESDNAFRQGNISLIAAQDLGYNTLLWKPGDCSTDKFVRPNGREFGQTDKKEGNAYRIGDLEVCLFNTNADGTRKRDDRRSGTLYNMSSEGQGTTAMMYFKWNQRYRFDGATKFGTNEKLDSYFVANDGTRIDEGYDLNENDPIIGRLDGKINWASSMHSHKMGSTALYHDCWKKVVGGNALTRLTTPKDFEDLDLAKMGAYFEVKDENGEVIEKRTPTAQEAFQAACKFTGRSNGYGSCRVCVRQEPFLYFVQPDANTDPVFYGMLTWGASKGDKPTFGYNKKFNKHFTMIEGSDNFRELIEGKVPWDDTHVEQRAWDDGEVSDPVSYKTTQGNFDQFEFAMGDASLEAVGKYWDGKNPCLKMFKDMANFIYLHSPNIAKFEGSYEDLRNKTKDDLDTSKMYWVTQASNAQPLMSWETTSSMYDLYRYNIADDPNGWVPAGLYDADRNTYARLNLVDQTMVKMADLHLDTANDTFITHRRERFLNGYKGCDDHKYGYHTEYPNGINDFMYLEDLQFTVQFLKLIAGTDNWAKNTYIYNTGVYYKQNEDGSYKGGSAKYEGLDKFRFFQDDLDTIFEIDNYGAKTKPYYVEEHDYVIKNGKPDYYWNSEDNALYKLAEISNPTAMKTIMNSILGAMADLGGGDPIKCFDKYYQQKAQKYFPEMVYNKAAEVTYIDGYYRGVSDERYSYYLSQCLGSQYLAEKDWQEKRVNYMSSYATYGDFAGGTSGAGLGFTPQGNISLNLTPHIWMYPIASEGSNTIEYPGKFEEAFNVKGRVPEGKNFDFSFNSTAGSENAVSLKGNRFYRDYGNLARVKPVNNTFNITGKYITRLEVVGTKDNNGIVFNPSTFQVPEGAQIDNLRSINVSGTVSNNVKIFDINKVDLSKLWRLSNLDLTATNIREIILPENSNLSTVKLPGSIQVLELDGLNKLTTFEVKGYSNLTSVIIKDMPQSFIDTHSYQIFNSCYEANAKLNTLSIGGINWSDLDNDQLNYLLSIEDLTLTGVLNIENSADVDFNTKMMLLDKFGNIDSVDNSLRVIYKKKYLTSINAVYIKGPSNIHEEGKTYQYTLNYPAAMGEQANDFAGIQWSVEPETYCSVDSTNGKLTLNVVNPGTQYVELTCTIIRQKDNGEIMENSVSKTIVIGQVPAKVGDLVYADGSYGSLEDDMGDKTVVGICIWEDKSGDVSSQKRLAVAVETAGPDCEWGLIQQYGDKGPNTPLPDFAHTWTNNHYGKDNPYGIYSWYINEKLAKDIYETPSMFTGVEGLAASDFGWGSDADGKIVPRGLSNTNAVIDFRNRLDGLAQFDEWKGQTKTYNSEYEMVKDYLDGKSGISPYFPAFSYCRAYEPGCIAGGVTLKSGEVLSDKFKAHNWFLPSAAELAIIWHWLIGEGYSPVFDRVKSVATKAVRLWSSTEGSDVKAHHIQFSESVCFWDGYPNHNKGDKDKTFTIGVLPVVVF